MKTSNRDVADKIDEALEADDNEERTRKLTEGKELLVERNKHILLAEKYGWDTVTCYTADPLASDSDDENKIRKAIEESKQLRKEKKRNSFSKVARPKGVIPRSSDRRLILDRNTPSGLSPFVAGKQNQARDGGLFVFVASNQVTSVETAVPPMLSTEQDQLDKSQVITNIQPSSVPFYGMDDRLFACEASMNSLYITSESGIFENIIYS